MEKKDRVESLLRIADIHRQQFVDRRKYEWKILFTVLTFNVLTTVASLKEDIFIYREHYFWSINLALATVTSIYLLYVHRAQHANRTIAEKAEDCVVALLRDEEKAIEIFPGKNEKSLRAFVGQWWRDGGWSWLWQTVVLYLFAVACAHLITANKAL